MSIWMEIWSATRRWQGKIFPEIFEEIRPSVVDLFYSAFQREEGWEEEYSAKNTIIIYSQISSIS